MKKILFCIFVIAGVFSISAGLLAAELTADLYQDSMGFVTQGKMYIKGDKLRMETDQGIVIIDQNASKSYTLNTADKTYMQMPINVDVAKIGQPMEEFDKEIAQIADKKQLGTEEVNGYLCDKYEIIYHDKSKGKMYQWYSEELKFPVKIVYESSLGKMVTEYSNVKNDPIDDSTFQVPADYKKMTLPGF